MAREGEVRMLIDGELVEAASGKRFENVNPATEEVLGEVADASAEDMRRAIAAARRAFDESDWSTNHAFRKRCIEQLQAALESEREEYRDELVAEVGTPRMLTFAAQLDWPLEDALLYPAAQIDEFEWERPLPKSEKMGMVSGDLVMLKPKLNGIDSDGNPFVVTADSAVQNPKNLRQATLKNVEADVNLKSGRWLNLTAPHGKLDSDAKTLQLWGAIAVFTDDGNEMHTNLAYVDLVKGVVVGPHHVTGQGPQGTYVADRFRIERLNDPCNKSKKAPTHVSKPKHPGREPQAICPAPVTGTVAAKSKPLIFLIGNVHMVLYHQSKKK